MKRIPSSACVCGFVTPSAVSATARPVLVKAGLVAAGVGMLAGSSWLSVPFYPVPLTMQTLAVLLVGGLLGARLGAGTVLAYLAFGLAGAPVFHNCLGGPMVLLGPTGGYLLGFVPAAFLMGWVLERVRSHGAAGDVRERVGRGRSLILLAVGAILAEGAIYAVGLPWLAVVYLGGDIGRAFTAGFCPYLLGDALKLMVAVTALRLGGKPGTHRRSLVL